ncbi:MAG: hypothetical protein MUF49_28805 [Oculatellaceae cyanobacterium Prado106]|nr:hypothetical protein [Oculatellaceae cyanobacterium Prado106]
MEIPSLQSLATSSGTSKAVSQISQQAKSICLSPFLSQPIIADVTTSRLRQMRLFLKNVL